MVGLRTIGYAYCTVTKETPNTFGMASEMGELMATLLLIVDAWFELADESAPQRFDPADRLEVLGLLVRLVARRFQGFRRPPKPDQVRPVLKRDSVGLRIRSPGRVPADTESIARSLAEYGFHLVTIPGTAGREILVTCHHLTGAQILSFPSRTATRRDSRGG